MSSLSVEEENYVRMSLLLTGLSPRAVRVLFDKEFPPTYLPSTLNQKFNTLLSLQKSRVINQAQWNLLCPPRAGVADSKTFDVTLMICLIRNLTSVTPPAAGFDRLPSTGDTTPGADLARIKYYRNYLAHLDDNKIDNSDFTSAWNDISDAIGRLGGASLYQESQDLKTKILDQSNSEIMLEVHNLKEEIEELKTSNQKCTEETETLKDTVPWNIREQITTELENWREKDQMYVDTRAASHVLLCTQTHCCVTVTGSSGVGKTFTVRHIALQMAAEEYDLIPVTEPVDIVKFNNPKKKTLYVIDDLCGTYTLNQTYLDKWKTTHEKIQKLLENDRTKIIASCRLQVYQDEQLKLLPLFTACECNLLLPNMSLSKEEKRLIAEKYLKSDASKIRKYIDLFDFFPLLCKLYIEHQTLNVVDFFQNPFSVYEKEIDKLKTEKAYGKYCALALCVMFNNHLKEEWLSDEVNHEIKQTIENTCEACRLNRTTPRLVLKDELDSLTHTFLKKEKGCYRAIHDKLFDFLSFYFGKTIITCIIKNGDCQLISERLLFNLKADRDQFTTIVPDNYQKLYMERMLDGWSKGEIVNVFTNNNMKVPEFRNGFLMYLKGLDIIYQKQLATKCDDAHNTVARVIFYVIGYESMKAYAGRMNTPLLHCCALGDTNMVQWCCSYGADVNYCSHCGESPLYIACKGGYTDIVTKLVDNKADINKCTKWGESPLYIACKEGCTDIVAKLLDNKADINICTKVGESPLYIACAGGFTDIVAKLVDNKADINMCKRNGGSPLYIACARGYTDIVTKLMDNKADINKCTNKGVSPLSIACKEGYADIVTKLMDNKADINKCTNKGVSPLYISCKGGYTDILTNLVDNKADINMCTRNGESPLYIACNGGYTDIVTKLLDNKADINTRRKWGGSPLYIACARGYTDIVTKLMDNKADINMCTEWGESSLYIACEGGYTDIVTKLVDNKADINKCRKWGESPLYIACKGGYTDIVTKLLDNKADINTCRNWGESPLYIACKGGYTDIVTKLLDNKADINTCRKWGESPLYIACKGGYTDIVAKLVDKKADINMCTLEGESPLYIACKQGFIQTVKILIKKGANHTIFDKKGQSPLDIARLCGHHNIVEFITQNSSVQ